MVEPKSKKMPITLRAAGDAGAAGFGLVLTS